MEKLLGPLEGKLVEKNLNVCISCIVELYLRLYLIIWKDTLLFGLKKKHIASLL